MTAGLRRAEELKDEIEAKRQYEQNKLKGLDEQVSGKQAATVYRDKRGLHSLSFS